MDESFENTFQAVQPIVSELVGCHERPEQLLSVAILTGREEVVCFLHFHTLVVLFPLAAIQR
jgi:hypothetical protein